MSMKYWVLSVSVDHTYINPSEGLILTCPDQSASSSLVDAIRISFGTASQGSAALRYYPKKDPT
jgi:hypothetical protein